MGNGILGWLRRGSSKDEFDCDDIRSNCSDYVDEEMAPAHEAKFQSHMNDCPDCDTFVNTFRATVVTLRYSPRPVASPDLQDKVKARIASDAGGGSGTP